TAERRPLTEPPSNTYGDLYPAFSPDGHTLAFARAANQNAQDLFLIPAAGGKATRLTSDNTYIGGIAWTRDSLDVIFSSSRLATRALWRLTAKASARAEPARVPGVDGGAGYLAVSRTRSPTRLVYERYTSDYDVWQLDLPHGEHPARLITSTRSENGAEY